MESQGLNIAELAEASGLSRRAIRFYVQRGLLPAPAGAGRGAHYETRHLELLRSIQELQQRGFALDAIRRRLAGDPVAEPARVVPNGPSTGLHATPLTRAWLRVSLGPGVELHFDPTLAALGTADLRAFSDLFARCVERPIADGARPDAPTSAPSSANRESSAP